MTRVAHSYYVRLPSGGNNSFGSGAKARARAKELSLETPGQPVTISHYDSPDEYYRNGIACDWRGVPTGTKARAAYFQSLKE